MTEVDLEPGLSLGPDALVRCAWANRTEAERAYHDHEWGVPTSQRPNRNDVFERLSLEAFQAGLSWSIILRKRDEFRNSFHGFDVDAVAEFTETTVEQLMSNPGIVRNRRKIEAVISNARVLRELPVDDHLFTLLESYAPPSHPRPRSLADIPGQTTQSKALARRLAELGLRFVGPTTAYASMQALGIVNDHLLGCQSVAGEDK